MFLIAGKNGMTALHFAHTIKEVLIKSQPVLFLAEKIAFGKTRLFGNTQTEFHQHFLNREKDKYLYLNSKKLKQKNTKKLHFHFFCFCDIL